MMSVSLSTVQVCRVLVVERRALGDMAVLEFLSRP